MDAFMRKVVLIGGGAAAGWGIAPKVVPNAAMILDVDRKQNQLYGAVVGGLIGAFVYYRTGFLAAQVPLPAEAPAGS